MQKDLHLASVTAYETGVALPLTNLAKELYRLAMRNGHAEGGLFRNLWVLREQW